MGFTRTPTKRKRRRGRITSPRDRDCISRLGAGSSPAVDLGHVPGVAALALVVIALSERRTSRSRFRMCVVAAAGAPRCRLRRYCPFYRSLHDHSAVSGGSRIAHIGQLVLLMIAILASCSVAV
jgi:hypothetical protein